MRVLSAAAWVSAAADGTGRGGGAVGGGALAEVTGAVVAVELGAVDCQSLISGGSKRERPAAGDWAPGGGACATPS